MTVFRSLVDNTHDGRCEAMNAIEGGVEAESKSKKLTVAALILMEEAAGSKRRKVLFR